MKNHSLAWTLLLLLILPSCATRESAYQPKQYGPGSVVAVWDMEDFSITPNPLLTEMQEFLTAKIMEVLADEGQYTIIERQKLLLALEELNLGSSEMVSEGSRLQIGRITGAQIMVFGGYQLIGAQLRIDLRMVEVESGVVIRTAEHTSAAADISGWIKTAEVAARELLREEA